MGRVWRCVIKSCTRAISVQCSTAKEGLWLKKSWDIEAWNNLLRFGAICSSWKNQECYNFKRVSKIRELMHQPCVWKSFSFKQGTSSKILQYSQTGTSCWTYLSALFGSFKIRESPRNWKPRCAARIICQIGFETRQEPFAWSGAFSLATF